MVIKYGGGNFMKFIFGKNKLLLIATILMSILFSFISVGAAIILENILDAVIAQDWPLFRTMLIVVPVYLVVTGIVMVLSGLLTKKLIAKTVQGLRTDAYGGILSRDPENFASVNTADYISALTNDVKTVEENALIPFLQSIQYILVFLVTVAALFYYSPVIAGLMFICLIVMYLAPASFGKAISKGQGRLSGNFAMFTAGLKDQLSGYDVIRSFQLTDHVSQTFRVNNDRLTGAKYMVDRLTSVSEGVAQMLAMGIQFLIMLVSGYMVLQGNMTAGVLLALIQLSGTFVQPVAVIMQSMSQIQGAKPVIDRVLSLGQKQPSAFNGTETPVYHENIELREVSFGYKPEQLVLNEVSLTFEKNKKYAIIGASGSGKSTLIKLLSANHGGYTGRIAIDGKDIRSAQLDELLAKISVIHQNVYMFDESIEENITLHRTFSQEEWVRAITVSGVGLFLPQMENGTETLVGENGANLSGGQRQRIAVARAIIQKKPILILDEGTSAVDLQTAYDIETALLDISDLTMLTITHNLNPELLRQYDQIVYIENGQVAAMGDYETLLHNNTQFCQFLQIQKKGVI